MNRRKFIKRILLYPVIAFLAPPILAKSKPSNLSKGLVDIYIFDEKNSNNIKTNNGVYFDGVDDFINNDETKAPRIFPFAITDEEMNVLFRNPAALITRKYS